jgi:protein TonB
MTLQYNILEGQLGRPTGIVRASRGPLGGAIVGSLAVHALAAGLALIAFSGQGPAVIDDAAITVFVEPNAAPVATASESTPTLDVPPDPPQPLLDYALPPPAEALGPPDFKTPPPRPVQSAPRPLQPKPAARQAAPSAPSTVPPAAAPSVAASLAPGWNALLAAWLAAHKTYPDAARKRSEEGEVTVRFTVAGDGRVGDVVLVKGSGFPSLDAAALGILHGAALPPPGIEATRTVRIRFRLSD